VLKGNTAAMDSLLADDYMAITASGTLQTKEQALDNLKTGRHAHHGAGCLRPQGALLRNDGGGYLAGRSEGTSIDGDFSGSYRYTRVYVRMRGASGRSSASKPAGFGARRAPAMKSLQPHDDHEP